VVEKYQIQRELYSKYYKMIEIPEIGELLALADTMFEMKEEEPEEEKVSKFGFGSVLSLGSKLSSLMKSGILSKVVSAAEESTED
jgi:hypothetical protein